VLSYTLENAEWRLGNLRVRQTLKTSMQHSFLFIQLASMVPIERWMVICDKGEKQACDIFMPELIKALRSLGVRVDWPLKVLTANNRGDAYVKELSNKLSSGVKLDMVLFLLPTKT